MRTAEHGQSLSFQEQTIFSGRRNDTAFLLAIFAFTEKYWALSLRMVSSSFTKVRSPGRQLYVLPL